MSVDLPWIVAFFATVVFATTGGGLLYLRIWSRVPASPEVQAPFTKQVGQEVAARALSRLGSFLVRPGIKSDALRKRLFRAGYRSPSALEIFSGVQIVMATILAVATGWIASGARDSLGAAMLPAICAAGFGFFLPARLLDYQVRTRARRIRQAVPASLDLLVLALESGQSLDQAMYDTSLSLRKVFPELCSELLFTHLEMRAGKSKQEALHHLADRSGEEEMRKLALLLIDGERFGTSLGPALRSHARYLRRRMRQTAQEAARKLTVKMVLPVFFLIFPSVLLVTLGPAYLQMREFLNSFVK
jgi:tight adherence protein C